MNLFPSIPGWDGIHPVMVQLTIGFFCVAPVLLIAALFSRRAWQTWVSATLLVMTLGVITSWLAVASGHAAGQLVDKTPLVQREVATHEALGIQARNLFTLFTVAFALLVFLPKWIRRELPAAWRVTAYAAFLVVGFAASLVMGRAASQGGRLVHELGLRAMVVRAEPAAPATGETATEPKHETTAPPPAAP